MISAVDTSILLDVLLVGAQHGPASVRMLAASKIDGPVVACDVVVAELAAALGSADRAVQQLRDLGIGYSAIDERTAAEAGVAHARWRAAGGVRERVAADFLIGAHAMRQADRLLTRDGGFQRRWFAGLVVVGTPTK